MEQATLENLVRDNRNAGLFFNSNKCFASFRP
jgi:hypothetical protein